jgi:hypothetical protein
VNNHLIPIFLLFAWGVALAVVGCLGAAKPDKMADYARRRYFKMNKFFQKMALRYYGSGALVSHISPLGGPACFGMRLDVYFHRRRCNFKVACYRKSPTLAKTARMGHATSKAKLKGHRDEDLKKKKERNG